MGGKLALGQNEASSDYYWMLPDCPQLLGNEMKIASLFARNILKLQSHFCVLNHLSFPPSVEPLRAFTEGGWR